MRYLDVLTYKHAHIYISMYTPYSDVLTCTHGHIYISMYTRYSDVLTYTHAHTNRATYGTAGRCDLGAMCIEFESQIQYGGVD